ncbi:TonB-dependent receptor domain-containing protein [Blastomonas sp.]|uniref:TonB-dependent receptor domain-containing protein n=1 Tax=Blastomonas sp. TaxID=1909299 RepID=UPI00391DF14B
MYNVRNVLLGSVALLSPICLQSAQAQSVLPSSSGPEAAEEIIVTGSRIVRTGADTSTPTVMLDSASVEAAGIVSAGDLLRQLPALSPGLSSESSGVTFNGAGLDLLDLRSLGTNRTLVLVNGRRQVGSNPNTTAVDINTIPTPMIERVEVITGGASAVYGADAVSGVVNFILKRDFDGIELGGQLGTSSRGDADRYSINATAGANFADGRGNITGHVAYTSEGGIGFDQRKRAISGLNWVPNPANTGPADGIDDFVTLANVRQLGGQQESMFLLNRGAGTEAFAFNADGSVRSFGLGPSGLIGGGQITDGGEAELGYDAQCPQAKCALKIPVERVLISLAGHYEVNESAELYFEGRFANTKSSSRFGSVFEIPPTTNRISIDNPFVTPSLRALMVQANVTSIGVLRSDQELGLRGQDTNRDLYQLVAGTRGMIGFGDLRYDASVQYGSVNFTNTRVNDVDQAKFLNALDAVRDASGAIVCRSDVARSQGCVPINFLQTGAAISPAGVNYIRIPFATETARLNQLVATANITGSIGDFWGAGNISFAGGIEYRKEESTYLTSPVDQAGQGFFFTRRQSTAGQFDVLEFYGEVVVPLLTDRPFFERLELEGAVRTSDYSTSGRVTSWKVGGTWAPVSDIRFRSVLARAVRAPNVGELFSPGSEGFITVDDPCDVDFISGGSSSRRANCAALGVPANFLSNARTINIRTATSGNAQLDVETADTLTVGAVIAPSFLPGFSATVDYFKIKISNAINVFGAQDILNNCVDLTSIGNAFCSSVTRAADGSINQIRRQNINVSRLDREGIDLELRYRQSLGDMGSVSFNFVGTHMMKVTTVIAPGTITGSNVIDFNGEYGFPEWKGRASATWNFQPFDLTGTLTYFSSMQRDVQPVQPEDNRATTKAPDFFLFNMQAGYELREGMRFFVGIDNLFDRQPPYLPETRAGGAGSFTGVEIYPVTGQFFYTGVKLRF